MTVECPKCGRDVVEAGAFICPGCDYILDATFLGDDITDDERDKRPVKTDEPRKKSKKPALDFGEDAMILGNVDDVAAEVSSFQSRDAGVSQREVTQARFYFGGAVAQLMEPDAIPEVGAGVGGVSIRMTPFERHVLGFVNGRRSIARIQKKSAMEETEFKTAVAMLADKGFIKLRGWKKQKATSASSGLGSHISQAVVRPPEPERTVVASMEHIEAMARQQRVERSRSLSSRRGLVPEEGSQHDTPAEHHAELATRIVANPTLSSPPVVPRTRFASLQADLPPSEGQADSGEPGPTDEVLAAVKPAAPAWDDTNNQSSVFADSGPRPIAPRPVSIVEPQPEPDFDPDGFDDGHTGALAALRDPTGMGDSLADGPADGAPIGDEDDDGDGDGDGDDGDDETGVADEGVDKDRDDDADDDDDDGVIVDPSFVSAEQVVSAIGHDDDHDDDDDDDNDKDNNNNNDNDNDDDAAGRDVDILGPARRIHDEVTAPPQPMGSGLQSDGEFDVEPPPTLQLPRPLTLPSEALSPVVRPPPPTSASLAALPGQGLSAPSPPPPRPVVSTPMAPPPMAPPPLAPPVAAPQLALPGQSLVTRDAPRAPAAQKPAAPTMRVSATSSVPFELRKKAERIYEQALKDQAEGRLSSALMNAKLAMNFDSSVEAYGELFEALNKEKAQPKGPRPQELVLFEQASEAEGKGEYDKAARLLGQAIIINPRAAALFNRLGVVLSIRLKRHDEALAHLKRAIELEPGSIVYMNNFSKVTGLLESVIEKGPQKKKKGPQADEKVAIKKMRPKMF